MYTRILILHTHCVQMCFTLSETHIGLCVMVCWYKHSIMGIIYRGSMPCCELNSWKSSGMVSGKEICVYETEMFCNIINVYVCVLTIAAVLQVWPDDVLLREAEHSQSSSSHCGINCHTRICHQLWSLIETNPKYTHRSLYWIIFNTIFFLKQQLAWLQTSSHLNFDWLTWCIRLVGGAAGTNGMIPCPSSQRFVDPSTGDAPDH